MIEIGQPPLDLPSDFIVHPDVQIAAHGDCTCNCQEQAPFT
jgi:hypothetical protein